MKTKRIAGSLADSKRRAVRGKDTGLMLPQEREEVFRQLAECIREVFWVTDPSKNRVVYISPGYEAIWGRSCESLYHSPLDWIEAIHEEDRARVLRAAMEQQASGNYDEQYRIIRPDGTLRWIQDRAFPVRDREGRVYRIVGVAEDISERKRAEERIRLLADAVQSTPEFISITDSENRFSFVNKAFLSAYGYGAEEVLGRTPEFLYSPKNPPGLYQEILKSTLNGGWEGEILNRTKDGVEFPILLTTSPIKDNQSHVLGLIGVARDISERKQAEKRSRAFSRLGHRLSAAATPEQVAKIVLEIASDFFGWDAAFVSLYSRADDKIVPILILDTLDGQAQPFPPGDPDEPTPLVREVMREGPRLMINEDATVPTGLHPFGNTKRLSASKMFVPIHSSGAVIGVLSVQSYTPGAYREEDLKLLEALGDHCGDALLRIRMSEALRQTESKYRNLFENATEGIFQTTPDGRLLKANPALARIFGYESPGQMEREVKDLARQIYVDSQQRKEYRKILETHGSVQGFEAENYHKDGSRIWISLNARAIRDAQGAVQFYEGILQDITARKRAELVLRESERKLRLIADNTTDVIFAFDMERRPLYVNPAVEKLTGYTFAEILERKFINWIHPEDQERMLKLWDDLYCGKSHSEVEFRMITKSGQLKWCSSSWGPLHDENGRQIGVQGRERDISERKQLEREVLDSTVHERRRIGHELHDGLGQFLAGVAFRAKALEQTLATEGSPYAAEAGELSTLVSSAIGQTRSLAKGLDPIEVETTGLPAALQSLAAETEKLFGVTCRFHNQGGQYSIDPQRSLGLYRITQEAIHNAITHGNARRVDIHLDAGQDHLSLQIRDDGRGFEVGGSKCDGMGLRVMQYRANSMAGELKIRSSLNEGTEIQCILPGPALEDEPDTAERE
jgi:PAS domain S-box-containing protein